MAVSKPCHGRESVCPRCGRERRAVLDKTWCYWCLIFDHRWIRVIWREVNHAR